MLRNPLTWLLVFIVSTVLAGCCGSVACNCPDQQDDALFFRFNLDTINDPTRSFSVTKLRRIYIRRVPIDTAQRPRADTIFLTGRPGYVATFAINNAQPFTQSSTRKLDRYDYTIYLSKLDAATQQIVLDTLQPFVIDTVRLKDTFVGNGCCTCNQNVEKFVRLDGQPLDVADPAGEDQPVYIQLNRKP